MKDVIYNLGLDYERKRMMNKAVSVYEYILANDKDFRDLKERIPKLKKLISPYPDLGLTRGKGRPRSSCPTIWGSSPRWGVTRSWANWVRVPWASCTRRETPRSSGSWPSRPFASRTNSRRRKSRRSRSAFSGRRKSPGSSPTLPSSPSMTWGRTTSSPIWPWSSWKGKTFRSTAARGHCFPSGRCSTWWPKQPPPWIMRTPRGSFIGTSNPPTSCS